MPGERPEDRRVGRDDSGGARAVRLDERGGGRGRAEAAVRGVAGRDCRHCNDHWRLSVSQGSLSQALP